MRSSNYKLYLDAAIFCLFVFICIFVVVKTTEEHFCVMFVTICTHRPSLSNLPDQRMIDVKVEPHLLIPAPYALSGIPNM